MSLPPVTSHQPGSFILTSWRREMSDGLPCGSATSGRKPAQVLTRSVFVSFACGKASFTTFNMYSMSSSSHVGFAERALVVGVRRAEDDTFAPGNRKQNAVALGHDDRIGHGQPVAVDHEVDAFGEPQRCFRVRQASDHGPAALTTVRVRTACVRPVSASSSVQFHKLPLGVASTRRT